MRRALLALLLCTSALIAACGGGSGGGGSSNPPPAPPPVQERTTPLRYGYFGIDGPQLQETADHVTFVFAPDWSEPYWSTVDGRLAISTRIITQLQEAKARGVKEAWVAVGFLLFDARPGACALWTYTPRPDGLALLAAFRTQLQALGLDSMVTVLYPVDEPELHCLSESTLAPLLQQVKVSWPAYLAVIYGDTHSYPGLRMYDLVGKDHYSSGAGVLDELPPITAAQKHLAVPGGSSGLSSHGPDDPRPFYDYAMAHGDVYAIVPFVWFDRPDGKGIRSNGMAPAYITIGQQIKGAFK